MIKPLPGDIVTIETGARLVVIDITPDGAPILTPVDPEVTNLHHIASAYAEVGDRFDKLRKKLRSSPKSTPPEEEVYDIPPGERADVMKGYKFVAK